LHNSRGIAAIAQPAYDEAPPHVQRDDRSIPGGDRRCTGAADVVAAVDIALECGLVVAVRCGGHGFCRLSTCDSPVRAT